MHNQRVQTIGLIGGMSWRSSVLYYRIVNEEAARVLGGFHSAPSVMYSVDSQEIAELQHAEAWDEATAAMVSAARRVEAAGAAFLLICSNTMHLMADHVAGAVSIPLLHSADATAAEIDRQQVRRVGFLGTKFTMERPFYVERLAAASGAEVVIPDPEHRAAVHRVVYEELTKEIVREESRDLYLEAIADLVRRGAEGVVLGCTEMSLLIDQSHLSLPLFDSTVLHAQAAVVRAAG
jgi:aspartate racemase